MTHKKTRRTLTLALAKQIVAARKGGATYVEVQRLFDVSPPTVAKAERMAKAPVVELEDGPAVPPGEGDDDVSGDLRVIEGLARQAAKEKNLSGVATLGRLRVSLLEHRRKAAPPPDMAGKVMIDRAEIIESAQRVRRRWHDLIDKAAVAMRLAGLEVRP